MSVVPEIRLLRWDISRLCCPSQGYFYFPDLNGSTWVLYIRWRSGPWTAELIPVIDIENNKWDWTRCEVITLSKIYPDEEECEEVMRESYEWLKNRFPDITYFPDVPEEKVEDYEFNEDDPNEIVQELMNMIKKKKK